MRDENEPRPRAEQLDQLRDAEQRERFALRRLEREAEIAEHALERGLRRLDEEEDRTAHDLEEEYRREHWGRPPARWPNPHEPKP
jgi:hypothetical protein